MDKKFFINSSLPRSGSTLMQVILHSDPQIHASMTSPALEFVYGARGNFNTVPEVKAHLDQKEIHRAFYGFCKGGIQGYYSQMTEKPIVVDKSRGWLGQLELLENILGEKPKVLVCVRDFRSVMSSFEKKWRKNPLWQDPLLNNMDMSGLTIEDRIVKWSNSPPAGLSIQMLKDCIDRGNDKYVHFVKFEHLTKNPEKTMRKVYEYLELDFFKPNYENLEQVLFEDDKIHGIYGDHVIRPEIKPLKKDYLEVLGSNVSNKIKNDMKWYFDYFQYV